MLRARRIGVNIVGEVPGHLLAARVNNGIRRAAFERRTRGTMKEEQGKKLDPNDPAIPAEPDKPTALPDEDLDNVAGGWVVIEMFGRGDASKNTVPKGPSR